MNTPNLCRKISVLVALFILVGCNANPTALPSPTLVSIDNVLHEYRIPTSNAHPRGIAFGPHGAAWFVETGANKIGRISRDGSFTEYPVPTAHAIDAEAGSIAVGPDGALWFNEDLAKIATRIGEIQA